jgi:hypothetical protein
LKKGTSNGWHSTRSTRCGSQCFKCTTTTFVVGLWDHTSKNENKREVDLLLSASYFLAVWSKLCVSLLLLLLVFVGKGIPFIFYHQCKVMKLASCVLFLVWLTAAAAMIDQEHYDEREEVDEHARKLLSMFDALAQNIKPRMDKGTV